MREHGRIGVRRGRGGRRGADHKRVTRRELLKGAGLGAVSVAFAVGSPQVLLGEVEEEAEEELAKRWPGKVIEVTKPGSIVDTRPVAPAVGEMLEAGMLALTGESNLGAAWTRFVTSEDVVGIKVNCSGGPQCSTSKELVSEIIRGLKNAGVPDNQIVVFDRFGDHLLGAGYRCNAGTEGVRCLASEDAPEPAGYDEEVHYEVPVGEPSRSFVSTIVTQMVTKVINVPVLKDHTAAGVTAALKNVAFGCINNTKRFHALACDPAIAQIWQMPAIGGKVVLNILDALRAQFDRGPVGDPKFCWNPAALYLGTDPVALDSIALWVVEQKRVAENLSPLVGSNRPPTYIQTAAARGLGVGDWSKINLVTLDLPAVGT